MKYNLNNEQYRILNAEYRKSYVASISFNAPFRYSKFEIRY